MLPSWTLKGFVSLVFTSFQLVANRKKKFVTLNRLHPNSFRYNYSRGTIKKGMQSTTIKQMNLFLRFTSAFRSEPLKLPLADYLLGVWNWRHKINKHKVKKWCQIVLIFLWLLSFALTPQNGIAATNRSRRGATLRKIVILNIKQAPVQIKSFSLSLLLVLLVRCYN